MDILQGLAKGRASTLVNTTSAYACACLPHPTFDFPHILCPASESGVLKAQNNNSKNCNNIYNRIPRIFLAKYDFLLCFRHEHVCIMGAVSLGRIPRGIGASESFHPKPDTPKRHVQVCVRLPEISS